MKVLTGGWKSPGYREFREFAPELVDDETEGDEDLLRLVFEEWALDLPGLFGEVGPTAWCPCPPPPCALPSRPWTTRTRPRPGPTTRPWAGSTSSGTTPTGRPWTRSFATGARSRTTSWPPRPSSSPTATWSSGCCRTAWGSCGSASAGARAGPRRSCSPGRTAPPASWRWTPASAWTSTTASWSTPPPSGPSSSPSGRTPRPGGPSWRQAASPPPGGLGGGSKRSDYDWSHLAARYFPRRVDSKCQSDPSLAVAHGCFWQYHPAKAYQWELRLQAPDELGPDFRLDEPAPCAGSTSGPWTSDRYRAEFERTHPDQVRELRAAEERRRARKAERGGEEEGPAEGELDFDEDD